MSFNGDEKYTDYTIEEGQEITGLIQAIYHDDVEGVKRLVKNGAGLYKTSYVPAGDLEHQDETYTPLRYAFAMGNTDIILCLLKAHVKQVAKCGLAGLAAIALFKAAKDPVARQKICQTVMKTFERTRNGG